MSLPSTAPAQHLVNLASARLGAVVLYANDEFFAPKERLLNPAEPEWRAGVYDDHGKWMDGWETRRRREPGHDHCVVRLAFPGRLHAFELDTRHFTGNYPPQFSIDACRADGDPDGRSEWKTLVGKSGLHGDVRNFFDCGDEGVWTHLRLNIFPDGGVARLRALGQAWRDWSGVGPGDIVELSAMGNGALALACSDEHYGAMSNLLLPDAALHMGDGWETRRRREPGHDWVIVRLAHPGTIREAMLDTAHFKGNFPHEASIDGAHLPACAPDQPVPAATQWRCLLPPQRLQADRKHLFDSKLQDRGPFTHVRVNIFPDGGLARVRLSGNLHRG